MDKYTKAWSLKLSWCITLTHKEVWDTYIDLDKMIMLW